MIRITKGGAPHHDTIHPRKGEAYMSYERIRGAHKSQAYAAEVLGIDRVTLHLKLKRFGWTRTPMESR